MMIRKQQLTVLEEDSRLRFEQKVLKQVERHWPQVCRSCGPAAVRKRVREGIAAARGYGFRTVNQITRYINITFALGAGFDADPRYPWARALLTGSPLAAGDKIDRLCDYAAGVLEAEPEGGLGRCHAGE